MSERRRLRPNDGGAFVAAALLVVAMALTPATRAVTVRAAEASPGPGASDSSPIGLIPRPRHVAPVAGCAVSAGAILSAWPKHHLLPEARELIAERWKALGVAPEGSTRFVFTRRRSAGAAQSYRLSVTRASVVVDGADADGEFYAAMTLAQLARRGPHGWEVPCVRIDDAPALRWRILSDDVSRGPLPTMRYFKERIRTLAAFKMNGYSPYMEHVFVDPKHPLAAPLDGITPRQLRELDAYARRFHVAFVPEQQTFAHMHGTLRWETNAPLAELPHGYLISPAVSAGEAYVRDLLGDELRAVPHPPFFHIGSDEPSDLGRGQSKTLVAARGEGPVYVEHVVDTANFIVAQGTRPMIWDDALATHPELFSVVPKQLVFVNWHYGSEPTYQPYIDRIAKGGFEQMVAPGALNWNEIYPDLDQAVANIGRFVGEGKRAHVLGLFQTVWHDDGESLFEATWYPVLYAGASAWEVDDVPASRYARDFPAAFFGSDDARFGADLAALGRVRTLLRDNPRGYGDYLFWADSFSPDVVATALDLSAARLEAESVIAHLRLAPPPPLHRNAAAVMALAARRYDFLGREIQIAREAREYYDDARANAGGKHDDFVYRGLAISKYSFWELRDSFLELEPLVKSAWEYENRSSHEKSVLERYHLAAQRAIARADRIATATFEYETHGRLPTFDEALGLVGPPLPAPSPPR